MTYSIIYKRSVRRDLKRLDRAKVRLLLDRIEKELSRNPAVHPSLKGEFAGLRRRRVGDYRVIFAVLHGDVLVLRIAHRKQACR